MVCLVSSDVSLVVIDADVSPKAAAEEIGYTFLPCVLAYLHRTPNLIPVEDRRNLQRRVLRGSDVDAVVVPVRESTFFKPVLSTVNIITVYSIMHLEDLLSCRFSLKTS